MKQFFLLITICISVFTLYSQPQEDTSVVDYIIPVDFRTWDIQQTQDNKSTWNTIYLPKINRTIEISAFISIVDEDTSHSVEKIEKQLQQVNKDYEPIGLSFKICKYNYFHGKVYDTVSTYPPNYDYMDLVQKFYEPYTINMYFVNTIETGKGKYAGGFATLPNPTDTKHENDYVFIADLFAISHELGHFFGLYHPHETSFGREYADGSNCDTAGDLLCDTPAEPDLTFFHNQQCHYTGNDSPIILVDPQGDRYIPSVTNIMSYIQPKCMKTFTNQQFKKMILVHNSFKMYLR